MADRPKPVAGENTLPEVSSQFVQECLHAEQLGDGALFAELHRGQFVFNKSAREWLYWQGHHWSQDIMDYVLGAVENVALRYGKEIDVVKEEITEAQANEQEGKVKHLENLQKKLLKRVSSLRRLSGRSACLEFAHSGVQGSSISIKGDDLDQDSWMMGLPNGILDLRINRLRPGRYDDWICRSIGTEMSQDPAEQCPEWETLLWESLESEEKIQFLKRWTGYCMSGVTDEQKFLILSGAGRNGKGVFIETVMEILGEYSCPIQSEMLLDQGRGKSTGGPTPDIMGLQGRRLVVASESDEARRFSASRLKWVTGSDTLKGRNPHDKYETRFKPTHKLILMTNNDPYAPPDDFAFWDRVLKLDWPFKFVSNPQRPDEKPRDPYLMSKLKKEYPGILRWMLEGCMEWQAHGLQPPACVTDSIQSYHREQDIIQDFIEERCFVDESKAALKTTGGDLYAAFKDWYSEYHNKARIPSVTWFGRRMAKKFPKIKDSVVRYQGVGLLDKESLKDL